MTATTPPHPFGHGRAPSLSEAARFNEIVSDLTGESGRKPRRQPPAPRTGTRARRLYGWLRTDESRPPDDDPR
jgi:hypothetical protein